MANKPPSLTAFQKKFQTEESCLDHLMRVLYGERHTCAKCEKNARYHRVSTRRAYVCEYCGNQVYPTAGTPFDRTRTPLRDWFFVMFQFCTSRHGVAAKEVERQLGVTYKTAWRMCHQISEYMGQVDGNDPIGGCGDTVEMDETLIGGFAQGMGKGYKANKTTVIGMMERGGKVITKVATSRHKGPMLELINANILPGSILATEEFPSYRGAGQRGYRQITVNHSNDEYYNRRTGAGTQGIEGYWAALKRGINGTHIHVSGKHLQKYLAEFEYRYNMRHLPHLMLDRLLYAFVR